MLQAEDKILRFGKTTPIKVEYLLSNTVFDSKTWNILLDKIGK
jgi:hypothetical protein